VSSARETVMMAWGREWERQREGGGGKVKRERGRGEEVD